jgi:general secretion pathway protein G
MLKFTRSSNRGFSLLELLLSIAIISLIILMATRYFSTVRSSQKVSDAVSMVQGIRAGATSLYATGGAANVTVANLCTNKQIPSSYCNGTTSLISPWESGTSAASTIDGSASSGKFKITIAGIPDTASCTNLCTALSGDTGVTDCSGCSTPSPLDLTFSY